MRIFTALALLFSCLQIAAQRSMYKYDYRFSLSTAMTESKILIRQEPADMETPAVRGTVKNNESTPVPFAMLQFTSLDSNRKFTIQADNNGSFGFIGKPGRYELTVTAANFLGASGKFDLHIHELLNAEILLGTPEFPGNYRIYSIDELSNAEVESIKKCVENTRRNKTDKSECDKKGQYYVMIEI
jgi:hypothetical protein